MTLTEFLNGKEKLPKGYRTGWLPFCTLQVKSGSLWAGDPYIPDPGDGCVVRVPPGTYRVEGIGRKQGRDRVVARLRAYLETEQDPQPGEEAGETGTDSAMIGLCDIAAFEAVPNDEWEQLEEEINSQLDEEVGILTVPGFPEAVMPFVPTGSDGSGPVQALVADGRCIGIELNFVPEEDE